MGMFSWLSEIKDAVVSDTKNLRTSRSTAKIRGRGLGLAQDQMWRMGSLKTGLDGGNIWGMNAVKGAGINATLGGAYGAATDDGDNRFGGAARGAALGVGAGLVGRGALSMALKGKESKAALWSISDKLGDLRGRANVQAASPRFKVKANNGMFNGVPAGASARQYMSSMYSPATRQRVMKGARSVRKKKFIGPIGPDTFSAAWPHKTPFDFEA